MPIYEYYCADCNGVFEQLLPVKRASEPQPCPQCDAESRRIMPTEFQAFTVRDGAPRRIPDRGTYWHLGQEVARGPSAFIFEFQILCGGPCHVRGFRAREE